MQYRQIKVERSRLENDAQSSQRFAGSAVYIETANAQRALLGCVKPGDKTKQRGFARPVEAEQHAKTGRPHPKGNIVERFALTIAMAHICDF